MAIRSRLNRILDEIQQIIVVLLHTKVRDPRLKWASITSVEVSKDLRYARVFFSALDLKAEINDTLKAFEAAAGFFEHRCQNSCTYGLCQCCVFFMMTHWLMVIKWIN